MSEIEAEHEREAADYWDEYTLYLQTWEDFIAEQTEYDVVSDDWREWDVDAARASRGEWEGWDK